MPDREKVIDKNELARENPEHIIGRFIMCIAVDFAHKDKHDPAIWPEWSDETKAYWEEIEQRMIRPVCLEFDWESAKKEIYEAVEHEEYFLKRCDHQTSWRVGIKDGLWKAYGIMEKYVKLKGGG